MSDAEYLFDDAPAVNPRQKPHPLAMTYQPPNRLMVPLPSLPVTTAPTYAIGRAEKKSVKNVSSSSFSAAASKQQLQQRLSSLTIVHEDAKVPTMDTPLSRFAVNGLPTGRNDELRQPGSASANKRMASSAVSVVTSADVFAGRVRGWLAEPCAPPASSSATMMCTSASALPGDPKLAPSAVSRSVPSLSRATSSSSSSRANLNIVPTSVLAAVLSFLDGDTIDAVCCHVNRKWYSVIRDYQVLTRKRNEFCLTFPLDGRGILLYLASRRRAPPSPRELLGNASAFNAAMGLHPHIKVVCCDNALPYTTGAASSTTTSAGPRRQRPQASSYQVISCNGDGASSMWTGFTSFGPSEFVTPEIPFAWVGIEFLNEFLVHVSGYSFCVSAVKNPALPLSWELQGCRDTPNDWRKGQWHTLHRHETSTNNTKGRMFTTMENGAMVFAVTIPPHRWGAMRRIRLIQMERNSQWGHALAVSGFEVYGQLLRAKVDERPR